MHLRAYTDPVDIEWDPAKAASNIDKHGIDFADAAVALQDEAALTIPDPDDDEEQRFVSLCLDPLARVLVVVYTWRANTLRVISARRATSSERRRYEVGL